MNAKNHSLIARPSPISPNCKIRLQMPSLFVFNNLSINHFLILITLYWLFSINYMMCSVQHFNPILQICVLTFVTLSYSILCMESNSGKSDSSIPSVAGSCLCIRWTYKRLSASVTKCLREAAPPRLHNFELQFQTVRLNTGLNFLEINKLT